tara:strand:+ start:931 stop:1455 length:525 start_codon:yes stop_codon:yes gene_type:complete
MPLDCFTRTRNDGTKYVTCKGKKDKKVVKKDKKVEKKVEKKVVKKVVRFADKKAVSFTKEERKKFGIDERGLEGVRNKKWWWGAIDARGMWRVAGHNFLRGTTSKEEADFHEFLGREKWEGLTPKQRKLKENEILIYRNRRAAAKKDAESMKAVGGEYGEGMKMLIKDLGLGWR